MLPSFKQNIAHKMEKNANKKGGPIYMAIPPPFTPLCPHLARGELKGG